MDLKENDIVIFKNEKRQEGTKQPEYTGKLNVNGSCMGSVGLRSATLSK